MIQRIRDLRLVTSLFRGVRIEENKSQLQHQRLLYSPYNKAYINSEAFKPVTPKGLGIILLSGV